MAITAQHYGKGMLSIASKKINLVSDSFKLMLLTSSYTPDVDTHQYQNDLTGEVSDANYTTGGVALMSVGCTYDAATNKVVFDAADVTLPGVVPNVRYAVIVDVTPGTAATNPLVLYIDLGADTAVPALIWSASGIATYAV